VIVKDVSEWEKDRMPLAADDFRYSETRDFGAMVPGYWEQRHRR
jgi:hypothetical protein